MKLTTIYGLLFKLEASYNAGGALVDGTDGIQMAELPELAEEWGTDGARDAAPPGTFGHLPRSTPSGRLVSLPVKFEPKGAGAAYSASVVPNIHLPLRAAGFDATLTSTAGSEKYVYALTSTIASFVSAVATLYARGEKYSMTGCYLDMEITFDGPKVPLITFTLRGLLGDPIDQLVVPAIAYPLASIIPPKALGAAMFTLGALTNLPLRSGVIRTAWELSPRLDMNSALGHAGFARVKRAPTAEFTIETPDKSALDPDALWKNATESAFAVNVGAVQYNRHKWAGPKFQLSAPPGRSEDNKVALTTLVGQLNPSALGLNDELTITFD